jgi:hypothetical protein
MIRGSCFCGGIAFEIDRVSFLRHCHCSTCRKETGSAFGTLAVVRPEHFHWKRGEDLVPPPDGRRTPLVLPGGTVMAVPAGLLDDDPGVRPVLHQFAGSKAPWWEIADDLPRYEKWVPGYEPAWSKTASE